MDRQIKQEIANALALQTAAKSARVLKCHLLRGGAIQQNWLIDLEFDGGSHPGIVETVLRTNSDAVLDDSLNRAQEFALFQTAWSAGVKVPEPLWLLDENSPTGRPLFLVRRLRGEGAGNKLVRVDKIQTSGLARALGNQLARIHSIRPYTSGAENLTFLTLADISPAHALVQKQIENLDKFPMPQPVAEWGLRWLEMNAPTTGDIVLCHNDYRTGNYMVDGGKLVGILDWEFTGWGDPMQDIGWLTARCWRFGADNHIAGGIGKLDDFIAGYKEGGGASINLETLSYWQIMATLRWLLIALAQGERHLSGREPSLELALTRLIVPELEYDILNMTMETLNA